MADIIRRTKASTILHVAKYRSLVSFIYVFQALEISTRVLAQIINEMIHTSLENDCCHALQ